MIFYNEHIASVTATKGNLLDGKKRSTVAKPTFAASQAIRSIEEKSAISRPRLRWETTRFLDFRFRSFALLMILLGS